MYLRAKISGETNVLNSLVFQEHLNQDVIDEALVTLIVVRNLPFRVVEWLEFHALCQALNPESSNCITTAHSQLAQKINHSWKSAQDIIRKKLQSALSSIHLSLDIWISPNRYLLLGICAHFVDHSQEKHFKALLALRTVVNHSGDEQFNCLLPALRDYGGTANREVGVGYQFGGQNWPLVVPSLASRFGTLNLLLTVPTQSRISAYTQP